MLWPSVRRSTLKLEVFIFIISLTCIPRTFCNSPYSDGNHISKHNDEDKDYEIKKPYQFGYEIEDGNGNMQHRHEQSDGTGAKRGSYGYVDANGIYRKVEYIADENGFRVKMSSNEPGIKDVESPSVSMITKPYTAYTEAPVTIPVEPSNKIQGPDIAYQELPTLPVEEDILHNPLPPPPPPKSDYQPPYRFEPSRNHDLIEKRPRAMYSRNLESPSTNYDTPFTPTVRTPYRAHRIKDESSDKNSNNALYSHFDSVKHSDPKHRHRGDVHYLEHPEPNKHSYERNNNHHLRHYLDSTSSPPMKANKMYSPYEESPYRERPRHGAYSPLVAKSHFDPNRIKGEPVMPILARKRPAAYPQNPLYTQLKSSSSPSPPTPPPPPPPPRARSRARPSHVLPSSETSLSEGYEMKPKVFYHGPVNVRENLPILRPIDNDRYILQADSVSNHDGPIHINKLPEANKQATYIDHERYMGANYLTNQPYLADDSKRRSQRAYTEFRNGLRGLFPYIDRNKKDPYGAGPLLDDASEKVNYFLLKPEGLNSIEIPATVVIPQPKAEMTTETLQRVQATSQAPLYRD